MLIISHKYKQFLIIQNMNADNVGKIIDKYRIESILQTNENGIVLMRAINVTNSEVFIIKKVMIEKENEKVVSLSNLPQNSELTTLSGLLYNEVNNIKDMNIPRILKCLQMIKTKRSLYLIYQNYPELNLERYLKQRGPVPALKIRFAKIICETLQQIHRKGYVYVNLKPSSIYVISGTNLNSNSYELRFVGFEYAKKLNPQKSSVQIDLNFLQKSDFLAPQIIETGTACHQSDIYSAGKIFQLLGVTQIKGKMDNKQANQTITLMMAEEPLDRSPLSKVWLCLKTKQNEARLFDHPVLELQKLNVMKKNYDVVSATSRERQKNANIKSPIPKRNIQQQESRLRKIVKIRTLVIYLNDLANFVLSERNKTLFYLLLKKSIIVRANLIHEIKKMLNLYSGQHYNHLNTIKQVLTQQQNDTLNLLSTVEENLRLDRHPVIMGELENRNQLNEQLMEQQIYQFISKKKKEIKPYHSILDEKERMKLIYLCSLSQKLIYGSFEKFFDEVVDDSEIQLNKLKYFGYLKTATTKQIVDRLQKILKEKEQKNQH